MIQDYNTQVSRAQAITTGTILGTDQVDLRPVYRDVGIGEPLYMHMEVNTTFDQVLSAMRMQVVMSPNANMSDADAVIVCQSEDILGIYLIAGAHFYIPIANASMSRALNVSGASIWPGIGNFLGVRYIVTGTAFGAGAVTTNVTREVGPQGRVISAVLGGGPIPVPTYPGGY
jgi:hypothetical protein